MDRLEIMRETIEKVLLKYTEPPFAEEKLETEAIFDRHRDRYLLVEVGWENNARVHHTVAHLDIINGKIWIQLDKTPNGIANDLLDNEISKNEIVLGFRSETLRKMSEFALA
ncbi:MAG TPA: XisI protein [Pyrinomonadaceae bacterium]|nr:XisI protein [Pyrinomonadaceae bacterium]